MRSLLVAGLLLVVLATAARPKYHELTGYTFDKYVKDFKKSYSGEEFNARKSIFESRLAEIQKFNAEKHSWHKGVNHMTDWTEGERRGIRGAYHPPAEVMQRGRKYKNSGLALPASVDYRTALPPVLTAVKDQGFCGSCWAHASTQSIETAWAQATGELYVLSQQQITSCTPNPKQCGGTGGCGGNIAEQAFDYVASQPGIAQEWSYSYHSYFGNSHTCNVPFMSEVLGISNYTRVGPNSHEDVLDALATVGPMAISVDASAWGDYEGGVFAGCNYAMNISMDHAVQLVGYGHDYSLGLDYWVVRNSWSPGWGESGFIRLLRSSTKTCGWNVNNQNGYGCAGGPSTIWVCGICGLLSDPLFVNVV